MTEHDNITLRPVNQLDARIIFEWQLLPETRKFARNPKLPEMEEHIEWFAKTLNDPDKEPYIIELDNAPVGMLRIDRKEGNNEFEISILVAPEHYGKGVAGTALQLARKIKPDATFMAYVMPENTASVKLFTGQGYQFIDNDWYQQLGKS